MSALGLTADIPRAIAEVACLATRIGAGAILFGPDDRMSFASDRYRQLYQFCRLDDAPTFDEKLLRTFEHMDRVGLPVPEDAFQKLSRLNRRRQCFERMEFVRHFPSTLLCLHQSHPGGWTIQVRAEPECLGMNDFMTEDASDLGLIAALRNQEEARQRLAILDNIALAIAVVKPDGTVLFQNACFESLVLSGDGFVIDERKRLQASNAGDSLALARKVAQAAAGAVPGRQATVCVDRPVGGDPHTVSISQGREALAGLAVVMVAPPKVDAGAISDILHRDFGLTPAEATFASLVGSGLSPDEAAQQLGKSLETGRSQMKAAYKKLSRTGATSQPRLVKWASLLASITAAAGRGKLS